MADVRAVKRFIRSRDFGRIVEHCRASSTTIGVLQDAFHENVLSRILRYLCSTSEDHGLGDRFLRAWLKRIEGCPFHLSREACRIDARFNWYAKTRSATNRYIDLVLLISKKDGSTPTAILGVETKIDAPESESQIEDYQEALVDKFPHLSDRAIFYLTPDGKANQTGKPGTSCRCYDVSYTSIVTACESLARTKSPVKRQTTALLRDLAEFLSKDLMKKTQRSQIDNLLKRLKSDVITAKALELLRDISYQPTIRNLVYEQLLSKIREEFGDVWITRHYPVNRARPHEFHFEHKDVRMSFPRLPLTEFITCSMPKSRSRAQVTVFGASMVHKGKGH